MAKLLYHVTSMVGSRTVYLNGSPSPWAPIRICDRHLLVPLYCKITVGTPSAHNLGSCAFCCTGMANGLKFSQPLLNWMSFNLSMASLRIIQFLPVHPSCKRTKHLLCLPGSENMLGAPSDLGILVHYINAHASTHIFSCIKVSFIKAAFSDEFVGNTSKPWFTLV